MRTRAAAPFAFFLLLLASPSRATEVGTSRNFGVGVQIGDPTAIVGKAFLSRGTAIDLGIGFVGVGWRGGCRHPDDRWRDCHGRHDYFSVHADWLWEETIREQPFRLDWHVGVGGRFIDWYEVRNRFEPPHGAAMAAMRGRLAGAEGRERHGCMRGQGRFGGP